jgi:hypothetical protein
MTRQHELLVESIAQVCHDANRAYALARGEPPASVYPTWEAAPEEIRESARIGVRAALDGATPEQLHESWCVTKRANGWTYGTTRDNAAKVHPCLVPYGELPAAQRNKDALFAAIVAVLKP